MNPNLPIGHRDPRTEIVSGTYLRLAADLIASVRQDLDYWNNVRVPHPPADRVPHEGWRRIAVFLPLALVALAFFRFHLAGALIAFAAILPAMNSLDKSLRRAVLVQREAWRDRDRGRYAFTQFMCKEFGLRPEDVTMNLVLKMCRDFKLWLEAAKRVREADEAAERARRPAPVRSSNGGGYDHGDDAPRTRHATGAAAFAASSAAMAAAAAPPAYDAMPAMQINPVTGLPMMDDVVDIHGNMYGTDSMDVVFDDMAHFNTPELHYHDGFEPQFSGFGHDPGG